jgi:hypothetical protein
MKKLLASVSTAAMLALAPAAHALVVALHPLSTVVSPGASFTVEVIASQVFEGLDPGDEVLTFGFDVTSSSSAIAFTGAMVDSRFLDDSGLDGGQA